MKKPFFPVFIFSLIVLFFVRSNHGVILLFKPLILICLLFSILFYVLKIFKPVYIILAFTVALVLGLRFDGYRNSYENTVLRNIFPVKEYITIRGKVRDFPEVKKENTFVTIKAFEIELPKGIIRKGDFNIRVGVAGDAGFLIPGETISIDCIVDRRDFRENFSPNPMKSYLLAKNIHFSAHSKSPLLIRHRNDANLFFRSVAFMRNRIRRSIESVYLTGNGELRPPGQLLEALLLGERGRLDKKIKEMLLNAGVFHLFAISGAHIGIITLFSLFVLGKFRIRKRYVYALVIILLLIFLSLTGYKISAQRAVIMAVTILVGKILYLKSDMINTISFSGAIILLKNPGQFLDPGFILTFAVTFGIVSGRYFFLKNPVIVNSHLKELAVTNLSASLVSLPFSIYFFKRYSFSGFFSGFLLLPLTGIIMSSSIPLIPLSLISIRISGLFMLLIQPFSKLFFITVEIFSNFVRLVIYRPSPSILTVFLFIVLFSLPKVLNIRGFFKYTFLFLSLIPLIIFSVKPHRYSPSSLEVFFLDVGQGDSEVVVFPGGDSLLIDGGGSYFSDFDVGKQVVLPFIIQNRIEIKWVSVSHFHPDHCRGVVEIINILDPESILLSSFPEENLYLSILMKKLNSSIKIEKIDASFLWEIERCKVKMIYPHKVLHSFYETNDNSQVLRVSDPDISFLFTGDIEKRAERSIVGIPGANIKSSVLKVPHHGSNTSSTLEFLKKVSPKIAVVSLSETNRFGFPDSEVVKRYKKLGIKLLRTSRRGGIKVASLNGKIFITFSKYRGDKN